MVPAAPTRTRHGIARINRVAWQGRRTLRWFARYEGWSDPGEEAALAAITDEVRGKRILDVGVGAGRTVPLLREISTDYTAIDFTEAMLDVCREKYPELRIEWGDARHLDAMDDRSFDLAVFSWNGIDAVDHADRLRILNELNRVLEDGGLLLFSTHNEHGPGCGEKPWTIRRDDFHHPKHLADLALFLPLNMANHLRHRGQEVIGDGWSIRNAAAHHFGLVIHYTTLEHQLAELTAAGFEPIEVRESEHGALVEPGTDPSSWWMQIVARKRIEQDDA